MVYQKSNCKNQKMGKIIFKKKNWSEVKDSVKGLNPVFFDTIEKTVKKVKHPYLYEVTCPYYLDIITLGKSNLFDQNLLKDNGDSIASFINDFSLIKTQPLSFITDGLVEVYKYNSYKYGAYGNIEYSFPLRIFNQGEIFGTYEVADRLSHYTNANYHYYVSSGHHSIYPLLPDPKKGNKEYNKDVEVYTDRLNKDKDSKKEVYSILDIFPLMIKDVSEDIGYKTTFLVFPSFWHEEFEDEKNHLNDFVMKESWIQAQSSREIQTNMYQRQKKIRENDPSFAQTKATYLNYLHLAKQGNAPVLKFHMNTKYEYLNELNNYISELTYKHYSVTLMVYDYLYEQDQRGIIPVTTLPFETSSSVYIRNSGEFIDDIGRLLLKENEKFWDELASRTYKWSWKKNPVIDRETNPTILNNVSKDQRLYINNSERMGIPEYFKRRLPSNQNEVVYSKNVFTKCIIEMVR